MSGAPGVTVPAMLKVGRRWFEAPLQVFPMGTVRFST